jgi:hypothetical protein
MYLNDSGGSGTGFGLPSNASGHERSRPGNNRNGGQFGNSTLFESCAPPKRFSHGLSHTAENVKRRANVKCVVCRILHIFEFGGHTVESNAAIHSFSVMYRHLSSFSVSSLSAYYSFCCVYSWPHFVVISFE